MRTLAILALGIALGITVTIVGAELRGGWYEYRTFNRYECDPEMSGFVRTGEIVPDQPNPCHYRRPRWSFTH